LYKEKLNLVPEYLELEFNISKYMLGSMFDDVDFKKTWGWYGFTANIIETITPNYYCSWEDLSRYTMFRSMSSTCTLGVPITSNYKSSDLNKFYKNSKSPFECCYNWIKLNARSSFSNFENMYNSEDDLFYITKQKFWYL